MTSTFCRPSFTAFYKTVELRSNNPRDCSGPVRDAIAATKVVKLVPGWHIPDLRAFYDDLTEAVARPIKIGEDFTQAGQQTGEKWLEIRYDHDIPDLAAYRHSRNAQPLHTDESYIADPADLMMFYAVNRARRGGETIFVDGPALVAHLREFAPELFRIVTTTSVRYTKADQTRTERIIDLDDPEIPTFNFNYYCVDPAESAGNKQINSQFFEYLQGFVASTYLATPVTLNPGEAVIWWDHFVLHGRTQFEADRSNDRFIWKAGLKWR